MTVTLVKFSFTVLGDSRAGVLEEMDQLQMKILADAGGEPWLEISDDVAKVKVEGVPLNSPNAFMYQGLKECVFMGPQTIEGLPPFRDGFRPQGEE